MENLNDRDVRYEDVVYALGDCASITDPHTGTPYPPTAQNAIGEGKMAAKNIISAIGGNGKIVKKQNSIIKQGE